MKEIQCLAGICAIRFSDTGFRKKTVFSVTTVLVEAAKVPNACLSYVRLEGSTLFQADFHNVALPLVSLGLHGPRQKPYASRLREGGKIVY